LEVIVSSVMFTLGWQEGHLACKNMGGGGGRHWLVRIEWHPAGWLVCLPLLIFACSIKSRSSLLALTHSAGPGKKGPYGCGVVVVYKCVMIVIL